MTIPEWQDRLANHFTANGLIGGSLHGVFGEEEDVGRQVVERFHGHNVLIDSFQSFYIDTINLALGRVVEKGWPDNGPNYSLALASFSNLFRRYRACEILFAKGYPLDGYASMRDIKDRAVMLAGLAHNMTTFPRIFGGLVPAPGELEEYERKSVRNRKNEENRIANLIAGKESGLSPDTQRELKRWDGLFHREVHGGFLSLVQEMDAPTRGVAPVIGPTFDTQSFAMYMNRSTEMGWLIVRLLPFLQMSENSFGEEWQVKHSVLDDSFRFMVQGLSSLGKRIGDAFTTLVDEKFSFREPFHYFEADGSD